jgi:hypothetical protein
MGLPLRPAEASASQVSDDALGLRGMKFGYHAGSVTSRPARRWIAKGLHSGPRPYGYGLDEDRGLVPLDPAPIVVQDGA